MAEMKRILITGASGEIGTVLRNGLQGEYRLRLYDVREPANSGDAEVVLGDINDLDRLTEAMCEVDTVIHLAGDRRVDAPWDSVLKNNIEGVYFCYEAAHRAGVRRVVFASSNHAMGCYDQDYQDGKYGTEILNPDIHVRPDSLYGTSKAFGEALGSYYADCHTLSVICFRIGWFLKKPNRHPGSWWMWLSHSDAVRLFRAAIECDKQYGIYYGTSNNTRMHWDLEPARRDLNYQPEDNAEEHIAEYIQ